VVDEDLSRLILDRQAGVVETAHRAQRPAHQARHDFELVTTPNPMRATATTGPSITCLTEPAGSLPAVRPDGDAPGIHTLIGAMMMHRRRGRGMVCGIVGTYGTSAGHRR